MGEELRLREGLGPGDTLMCGYQIISHCDHKNSTQAVFFMKDNGLLEND